MPGPKRIYGRNVWDVRAVDRAFEALPGGEDPAQHDHDDGGWDEVLR
ncbi:hypothetical protein V8J36_09185 [Frigidibacter sp. MR17.14]